MNLGSKLNPCKDYKDVKKAITGNSDCTIYIIGIFELPTELWKEIYERNIKLSPIRK